MFIRYFPQSTPPPGPPRPLPRLHPRRIALDGRVQVRGLTLTKYLWQPVETPFKMAPYCTNNWFTIFFLMVPKFFTITFTFFHILYYLDSFRIVFEGGKSSNPLCSLMEHLN